VCKKSFTNSQPFVKKNEKMSGPLGGIFLTHTVHITMKEYNASANIVRSI